MALPGAGVLLRSIVATGIAMRQLIDSCCKMSQELKDFDHKLGLLRRQQRVWEAQIHKLGLGEDRELKGLLRCAQSNIDEQKARLAKLATGKAKGDDGQGEAKGDGGQGRWRRMVKSRWWEMLKWSVSPSELRVIIDSVTKVFDDVLNSLSRAEDIATKLEKKVLNKVPSLGFRPDSRYIRLAETNKKIMDAVRESDSSSVVLLHGGPGKGKSSLARDVALQFQQQIDQHHESDDEATSTDPQQASTSTRRPVFKQVVFLECGPEVDLQAKQSELREKLGWSTNSNQAARVVDGEEPESKISLAKSLSSLLKSRALLIILDDVWNPISPPNFLQTMIDLSGKNVKWLVTSRLGDLCESCNRSQLDFIAVPMEDAKREDARKILAVHFGLPETTTSEVQGFMDRVIEKVDANPLALTCVAPAIDKDSYNDKREWRKLDEELSHLLDCKAETLLHSKEYGQSYWQAIKVGFDLLNTPHQNLLILIHMCKGPSIPEIIIEYLFQHTRDKNCYLSFSQARRALKERHLVKVDCNDNITRAEHSRSWSIHSLLKEFIRRTYFLNNEDTLIWETLSNRGIVFDHPQMECEREWNVVIAMAALYFERDFHNELIKKFATKMDVQPCTFQLAGTRGYVIEPIAQLLMWNEDEDWTPILHSSSREVFLEYSGTGTINQNGTSALLDSSVSSNPMLTTLSRLRDVDRHIFFGKKIVSSLLKLLESECICSLSGNPGGDPSPTFLNRIATILEQQLHMSDCRLDDQDKIHLSNVFEQLSAGLAKMDSRDLRICSARALADLACANNYVREKAVAAPGLVEGLGIATRIASTRNVDCQELMRQSARAIENLAFEGPSHTNLKIVNCIGTLETLVAGLKKEQDEHGETPVAGLKKKQDEQGDTLQYYSSSALANLAAGSSLAGLKITNCRGALHGLMAGLMERKSPRLQERCGRALRNLVWTNKEAKWQIIKLDGALVNLVSLTAEVHEDEDGIRARVWSSSVLSIVASGADRIKQEMMLNCPGIVDDLTNAMTALVNNATNKMEDGRDLTVRAIMKTLTLLNPGRAMEMHLDSAAAYLGRGIGELQLGLYHASLQDFNECEAHLHRRGSTIEDWGETFSHLWCSSCCAKANSGDLEGALAYANILTERSSYSVLARQERGVLKYKMGDLPGALADFDRGLSMNPDDFEMLKHRGYVKSLLNDEEGARADAERAIQIRQDFSDCFDPSSSRTSNFLGASLVEYLNFKL